MLFLLASLLLLTGGTGVPSQDQMSKMYAENLRLKAESEQLDKQLAELNLQIEQTKKALANLQYVEQENGKWMQKEFSGR